MTGSSDLFLDDETTWWEEPAPWEERPAGRRAGAAAAAPLPAARPRRRRPPPRTLAGDLARLHRALAPRLPAPLAALAALALVVGTAAAFVVLARGDRTAAVEAPARAAPEAPSEAGPAVVLPGAPADPVLRRGDRGAAVRDLQHALAAFGYAQAPADGAFGAATADAVAAFQAAGALLADGIVGSATTAALRETALERARESAATARRGLAAASAAGLDPEEAAAHRETVETAVAAIRVLPPGRGATIALVLADVAAHADVYDGPRARALFGMLAANVRFLAERPLPGSPRDVEDEHGVVHRFFAGHGFQFHPLASFARLNRHAARERRAEAARLAAALVARGVPAGRTVTWEYYFPFGGPARWVSALAQAAGAQALARAGALLGDPSLHEAARAAYRAIPRDLSLPLGGGVWVREYGYSDMAILNAQLQSVVSLAEYARLTDDRAAERFVERLTVAARTLLPELDTGCWSRYSLGGAPATPHYHDYHVRLLGQIGRLTGDPYWTDTGARWDAYRETGGPTAC